MSEMRFWYPASITQITSANDSFDSCILSVCYAGRNRNKTIISKEAIEGAVPTMAYCPIVANYDVESDVIGGHDVGFSETSDGTLKMINLTDAIGVIPENPQWCWQKKTDPDGVEREYLSTPAILWKRTPVYEKLKRDGVTGQSMEINVKNGKVVDGLFEISAFEFTAFCLLGDGVEPCFEGAQVETFSLNNLSNRLAEMMDDFKRNFSMVMAASADDIFTPKGDQKTVEGGNSSLNIEELMQKYGLTAEDIKFDTTGMSAEDIEARFAEIRKAMSPDDDDDEQAEGDEGQGQGAGGNDGQSNGEGQGQSSGDSGENNGQSQEAGADNGQGGSQDSGASGQNETQDAGAAAGESQGGGSDLNDQDAGDGGDPDQGDGGNDGGQEEFSLTGNQLRDGILEALRVISYVDEWGEWPRYCFTDYDPNVNEVYAYDNEDWNLYGFKYTMNGDVIVIDFGSKTRKKIAFVDFENGDAQFSYQHMMDSANARFTRVAGEVAELRQFKKGVEDAERSAKIEEVFAGFTDLAEDERFKALCENCADMSVQEIEDKCYAIRGRNVQVKFSQVGNAPVRMPVERGKRGGDIDEPYGGVFLEYGIANRNQ